MRRVLPLFILLAAIGLPDAGQARGRIPAFPRSAATESVFASQACWRGCQSSCTWELAGCVKGPVQGVCLQSADGCDRYCQIRCRRDAGPLVPDWLDFSTQ